MFARVYSLFTLFALLGSEFVFHTSFMLATSDASSPSVILSVSASPVLFPSYAVGPELKARICGRLGCKIAEFVSRPDTRSRTLHFTDFTCLHRARADPRP
jgi:hypothetical protein